jgi:16S rRNA processing protein RimM
MKITVAYIKGPRGFRGELAAVLYNPLSESLHSGLEVTLDKGEMTGSYEVEYIKQLKNRIGLKLKGIEDVETAERWKGAEVYVEKDRLQPLSDSEYYHFELEGAQVYDEAGGLIGTVIHVESGAGNVILNVSGEKGEILIPFVKAIITLVDIENKKIVVRNIEGLY